MDTNHTHNKLGAFDFFINVFIDSSYEIKENLEWKIKSTKLEIAGNTHAGHLPTESFYLDIDW